MKEINSNQVPVYSNFQNYQYSTGPVEKNISYTVTSLRPGSNEVSTKYSYNSNFGNGANENTLISGTNMNNQMIGMGGVNGSNSRGVNEFVHQTINSYSNS